MLSATGGLLTIFLPWLRPDFVKNTFRPVQVRGEAPGGERRDRRQDRGQVAANARHGPGRHRPRVVCLLFFQQQGFLVRSWLAGWYVLWDLLPEHLFRGEVVRRLLAVR